ncbi:MAG: response regulator [Verrucomicrobiota bacterium]
MSLVEKPAGIPGAAMLLVDDNAAFREITALALGKLGFFVKAYSSGDAALESSSMDSRFQLLMTDVIMASMNGIELAERVRLFRPEVKVLFCSGYPRSALLRNGLDLGRGEFLMKPMSIDALSAKIQVLLGPAGNP